MFLAGKRALVTGSTSGIGLAIARALAAEGAEVVLNGFGETAEIEGLCNELRARHVAADLTSAAGVEELMAGAGPVDILVNNAGMQHVAPVEEFPPEKWDAIIALNLSATFHAMRAVLGAMKARRAGCIVNIASAHGLVASPFKSAYVAAKHGVVGLTKVAALEAAEHGVTCNAICPGYVMTPLVEKQIDDQARAHGIPRERVIRDVILAPQPSKRFVTVEEIGAMVVFLAGPNGASINGAALAMDGGWTAR